MYHGRIEDFLDSEQAKELRGKVQLIFTSPPFPLNRKKKYGNLVGEEYKRWLAGLAPKLTKLLKPDGSIVVEVGNSWNPGEPTMSTLALESLLAFREAGELRLCQQFVCHNPARLPSPAQWVTIDRIRLKDSFTHVWWFSPSAKPNASNRRVLTPYSAAMLKLLKLKKYNAGKRPSEHDIGAESFLSDNGGAIPANVLQFTNTRSGDNYLNYCRTKKLKLHPARMPVGLAEFFIKFLTTPKNLVLDPFGGSNVTGAAAESLKRRWLCVEADRHYIDGSRGRFESMPEVTVYDH
ncbi:MAG: site-specific DNA-methyltransferase [Phycisphaeraceae bacterium]|nr:MAG: site-specific DNA-methyltransferase [Phycisphaeraceae bacterium]